MNPHTKQLTFLLSTITLFSEAKLLISLQKALNDHVITADVTCKGGLCVDYKIKNHTDDSLTVMVPAGWRMNSVHEQFQDILVTRDMILAMGKQEKKSFEIKGYCCEATHSGPIKGETYEPGKIASPALLKIAEYLNTNPIDENTQQYAVWAVSDNKPTNNITTSNDSIATLLRHFVAGVKGEPIPWYTLMKKVYVSPLGTISEYPIRLKANVNYSVGKTCYAWFFVTDSLGRKVGQIDGQWLQPGSHEYAVNINLKEFKKGKYKMKLAGEGEEFISRDFEI
jgi:hypothetical protein